AEGRLAPGAGLLRQAVVAVTGGQPVPGDAPQRFLAFPLAATALYHDAASPPPRPRSRKRGPSPRPWATTPTSTAWPARSLRCSPPAVTRQASGGSPTG